MYKLSSTVPGLLGSNVRVEILYVVTSVITHIVSMGGGGQGTRKPASECLKAHRYWLKEVTLNSKL